MTRPTLLTRRFWRRFFWRYSFWTKDFWRRHRQAPPSTTRTSAFPWVETDAFGLSNFTLRMWLRRFWRLVRGPVLLVVLLAAVATLWVYQPWDTSVEVPVADKALERIPAASRGGSAREVAPGSSSRSKPGESRRSSTRAPVVSEDPGSVDALKLMFPIAGASRLTNSFGDPRPGGRSHEGVDIMADKRIPVVAVAAGEVVWLRGGKGEGRRGQCCSVAIRHAGGWNSRYLHLDNDRKGTDDGKGYGIVRGLKLGATVRAGEKIGWVGDSGNAEHTAPHLHFELRHPDGHAIDPFPSLARAVVRDPEANAEVILPSFPAGLLAR